MFPERIKLQLEDEIDGFERTTINRLLGSFANIESEAAEKRKSFLERKSRSFNPDRDDEACIEEDGYFEELNYVCIETALKQEYINSIVTWLFHLFERQKKRTFGSDKTDVIKPLLSQNSYNLDCCTDWNTLNKELRFAANAIKHGPESESAIKLFSGYPNLVDNDCVVMSKSDIERYLVALRNFWDKALDGQVVL